MRTFPHCTIFRRKCQHHILEWKNEFLEEIDVYRGQRLCDLTMPLNKMLLLIINLNPSPKIHTYSYKIALSIVV